jgi:short-subunit dehydrogenase
MEVDYFGTVALTKLVAPRMIAGGEGSIVTISSVAGKLGAPMRSAYAGAKHAIIGFMDCLRAETLNTGLGIHIVCPGWVQTDVSRNALTASGDSFGEIDADIAAGMPVDKFVALMLQGLARDRAQLVIADGKPRLGYHLHRLLPNTFFRLLPRIYSRDQ